MTGTEVMELLTPLVDFMLKTPVQAFVDTLPPQLKEAILNHHVLVGMSPEMVKYAMGHPDSKSREREGDMPFEEWIYGQPPADVEFVRFNGNRVIRVEECKMGEPPIIRDKDEMGDYWNTVPTNPNIREVKLGDRSAESTKQESAVTAAPSLRKPGETLPNDGEIPQLGAEGAVSSGDGRVAANRRSRRTRPPTGVVRAREPPAPEPQVQELLEVEPLLREAARPRRLRRSIRKLPSDSSRGV